MIRLTNKEKQRAEVFSPYWEGAIVVAVAPPGNVYAVWTAAARIANKDRGCDITRFDLIPEGVTTIIWDEPVFTKEYIHGREKALRPPKPKAKPQALNQRELRYQIFDEIRDQLLDETPEPGIPERCPYCQTPEPGNPCRECGNDSP